ncbi:signal peptidase I [Clostridium sp. 19966]|uniref:signal peptidase I n=1 Tax=Clostridium sp. 19966 TaxID=2768166 RepID=UPI0028DD7A4A|nr:signal peptidase I [Clostridium sp. 19966]MDT8718660.1 signal peptidase I [Clostridium sp. 19966]
MEFDKGKNEICENETVLNNTNKKKGARKFLKSNLFFILICVICAFIIRTYLLERADVDGISMYPTLNDKDVVFVEKISDALKSFSKGQIIIFTPPNDKYSVYIKRIIALSGDTVEIKNGRVLVDGKQIKEDYLSQDMETNYGNFITEDYVYTVPKNYVFVMGDNRDRSNDSRNFGPVPIENIRGHAFLRVKPLDKFTIL